MKPQKVTFLTQLLSAMASFFGVQSNANRIRDFQQPSPIGYILAGLLCGGCLLGGVYGLVKLAIHYFQP